MFINFSRLLSPKFIFASDLGAMQSWAKFFYVFFGLALILALAAKLMERRAGKKKNLPYKKLWLKWFNFLATLGVIGLVLLFLRQQAVYFFSMPFLWYLFGLAMLVWLFFILRWQKVRMKKIIVEIKEKQEKEKYL